MSSPPITAPGGAPDVMPAPAAPVGSPPARTPTPPASPPSRRRRTGLAAVRRWLILLLIVAACAALAFRQIGVHSDQVGAIELLGARVVTPSVEVRSMVYGRVTGVAVDPGQRVDQRQVLLQIRRSDPPAGRLEYERVLAPRAGRVLDIVVPVGQSVRPGDLLARMYQPEKLVVRADIADERLGDVREGMRARLELPSGRRTVARVARLEPRLEGDESRLGTSRILLEPVSAALRELVPGVPLAGELEGDSARRGARPITGV